tara:strand:- start:1111 stop:1533 length:423 start_codon:yes stop_codon:yes gene_type:complete
VSVKADWWQNETIYFECQPDCFKCCSKPGLVFLTTQEAKQAAQYLGISLLRFKSEFLTKQDKIWLIEVEEDHPCPFLTHKGCAIHEAKPVQCRTYPFWHENMESKNHWALTSVFCPGIGNGPEIEKKEIKKFLNEDRSQF